MTGLQLMDTTIHGALHISPWILVAVLWVVTFLLWRHYRAKDAGRAKSPRARHAAARERFERDALCFDLRLKHQIGDIVEVLGINNLLVTAIHKR